MCSVAASPSPTSDSPHQPDARMHRLLLIFLHGFIVFLNRALKKEKN